MAVPTQGRSTVLISAPAAYTSLMFKSHNPAMVLVKLFMLFGPLSLQAATQIFKGNNNGAVIPCELQWCNK